MNKENLNIIDKLILDNKIDEAQFQLSNLGSEFYKNPDYLYLRSKIFYLNKLYYIAIDTLLIALEFEQKDKFYNLISKIYKTIDNQDLSEKILDVNLRHQVISSLKDELSSIFRKKS
jgi:hypothetical protein